MDIVYFDLETQRTFDEVGGRGHIRKLGLAVAVTYNTAAATYHHYTEDQVDDLITELKSADLIVGYNVLAFDYEVLRAYSDESFEELNTADMLAHLHHRLGFRVSLNSVATATLNVGKSADGLQAVAWFREGLIEKVLDYCQQDVEVTKNLYEYGKQHKHVYYWDRYRGRKMVPVDW
ncbi:MAG TPA: ribonuclease H-like domain-containing protein [Anaerolineae bacterium]|nr:ribonuclease H-like domain-containing protein [Anaerolineae bacterium]